MDQPASPVRSTSTPRWSARRPAQGWEPGDPALGAGILTASSAERPSISGAGGSPHRGVRTRPTTRSSSPRPSTSAGQPASTCINDVSDALGEFRSSTGPAPAAFKVRSEPSESAPVADDRHCDHGRQRRRTEAIFASATSCRFARGPTRPEKCSERRDQRVLADRPDRLRSRRHRPTTTVAGADGRRPPRSTAARPTRPRRHPPPVIRPVHLRCRRRRSSPAAATDRGD